MDTPGAGDEVGERDDTVRENVALFSIPPNDHFTAYIIDRAARRNASCEKPAQHSLERITHRETPTAKREVLPLRFGQRDAVARRCLANTCGCPARLPLLNHPRDVAENAFLHANR